MSGRGTEGGPGAGTGPDGALVIGYGNPLRGDDGVGPRIAEVLTRRGLAGVRALAAHQLTPELAEPLAAARLAIFVDAGLDLAGDGLVCVRPLAPARTSAPLGHAGDPRGLLALAHEVFGRSPPAWLVTVPAARFGYCEGLSETARQGMAAALRHIGRLVDEARAAAHGEADGPCTKSA
jgi:hydrogenase maturation protease